MSSGPHGLSLGEEAALSIETLKLPLAHKHSQKTREVSPHALNESNQRHSPVQEPASHLWNTCNPCRARQNPLQDRLERSVGALIIGIGFGGILLLIYYNYNEESPKTLLLWPPHCPGQAKHCFEQALELCEPNPVSALMTTSSSMSLFGAKPLPLKLRESV